MESPSQSGFQNRKTIWSVGVHEYVYRYNNGDETISGNTVLL